MSTMMSKQSDLAGPGIGSYEELEEVLPQDYNSLLGPKDTHQAITLSGISKTISAGNST
jgi:hypothetical protein